MIGCRPGRGIDTHADDTAQQEIAGKTGGAALGLKADAYQDIAFNFVLTPRVEGKDNQIVERLRASATA